MHQRERTIAGWRTIASTLCCTLDAPWHKWQSTRGRLPSSEIAETSSASSLVSTRKKDVCSRGASCGLSKHLAKQGVSEVCKVEKATQHCPEGVAQSCTVVIKDTSLTLAGTDYPSIPDAPISRHHLAAWTHLVLFSSLLVSAQQSHLSDPLKLAALPVGSLPPPSRPKKQRSCQLTSRALHGSFLAPG